MIPRTDILNDYMGRSAVEGKEQIEKLPKEAAQDWEERNPSVLPVLEM